MSHFLEDITGHYALEKKKILTLCENGASYSLADFAHELGSSIPKVSRVVNEMIEEGYIAELGKLSSATGRRPSVFGLNPQAGFFVGVNVDKDSISIAITDFPGKLISFLDAVPFTLMRSEESVKGLCSTVLEQLEKEKLDLNRVRAYGINLTGRVNNKTGYSYSYFISEEKPIQGILEAGLGKPVTIENDSRGMAYGEYMSGIAGDAQTVIFLNVGWGLGMGMVLDGKLHNGKSGFSGEIGHFPLLDNKQICRCGKIGCLETGASGIALHRLVMERLQKGNPSMLSEAFGEGKEITLEKILEALKKEDTTVIECVERVGATLGRAVAGLINIFNPDVIVIGGRLSSAEHYLMPPLMSSVNKYSLNLVSSDTVIKVSKLGNRAGALGASMLSKTRLINN